MKSFSFRLPVKKYIQKYLTAMHGETIPAVLETDIGFMILMILSSRLETKVRNGFLDQWGKRYNTHITFTVPIYFFYLTKKEISPSICYLINRHFENRFEADLCRYIENYQEAGEIRKSAVESFANSVGAYTRNLITKHADSRKYVIKNAIKDFCQIYNIEIDTDISMDALLKMQYRNRKKKVEKSIPKSSDDFSLFKSAV